MKKLTLVLALALSLGACKKNSGSNTQTSGAGILTSGSWRITSSISALEWPAPVGTQSSDLFALLDACEQDNLYIFSSNGTATADEGPTKCNASDPQTKAAGSWSLSNNDKSFSMSGSGFSIPADVLTLNNSTFTIQYVTNINGIKATTTTSYTHVP